MYQIDSVGSVTLLPAPTSPGTPGFWSAGNAGAGIRATRLDQDWFNMLQNTLVFVQRVAGLSDSKSDYTQLYTALLSCSRLTDTGAVNALAATPVDQPAWASLPPLSAIPDGFLVRVVPVATSTTTTPTFSFNGGAAVGITDALGAALLKGDIIAGVPAELMKAGGAAPTWWLLNPRGARISDNYYDTQGTYSLPVPSWAAHCDYEVGGAGGGSMGSNGGASANIGASGAAGGEAKGRGANCTPGANMTIIVGAGGAGATGSSGGPAGNGGSSSISGGGLGSAISATGGTGGGSGPGIGGSGAGGIVNLSGQAGTDLDGHNPSAPGGNSPMGGMGGVVNGGGATMAPTAPGGGGGANNAVDAGQNGADGGVRVTFIP